MLFFCVIFYVIIFVTVIGLIVCSKITLYLCSIITLLYRSYNNIVCSIITLVSYRTIEVSYRQYIQLLLRTGEKSLVNNSKECSSKTRPQQTDNWSHENDRFMTVVRTTVLRTTVERWKQTAITQQNTQQLLQSRRHVSEHAWQLFLRVN